MPDRSPIPYQRAIQEQALTFLQDYALTAYAVLAFSLSLVAMAVYQVYPSAWVVRWIVAIWLIETLNLMYRLRMPRSTKLTHKQKIRRGILINIFEGLVIASCLLFFPYIDDITRMLIVTILLIACTGAIATTVGYIPFYYAFAGPIIVLMISLTASSPTIFNGSNSLYIVAVTSLACVYPLIRMSDAIFTHFKDAFDANMRYLKANEELEAAVHEARRANQSKTRFLASASHDLRQPINTLSLFVANLSLKDVNQEHAEIIGHMNTAINSVDAQLESLLDISKLDAGIVQPNLTETDLVRLTDEMVSSLQKHTEDQVDMHFECAFDSIQSETDPVLFERVLNNLIGNAIKYTPEGKITISINVIGDVARISVKDTGIGIEQDEQERVFEEFYQIGNPERSEANGLGLGLSIVVRLADLLGLRLDMTSEPGVGTEMTVSLPAISSVKPAAIVDDTGHDLAAGDHKHVLALDNEWGILIAMRGVVETMGHTIETFSDAKSALSAFAEQRFDLALIDFRLPGSMNGQEIVRRMRSINPHTRFFLVTGDSNIDQAAEDCEIIYKPITGKKLKLIFD